MIVDFHCHNFPRSVAARALAALSQRTGGRLNPAADGTLENHLDHLDLAGVDKAVMMPVATKPTQFDVILSTAKAIRDGFYGERAARKIVPFGSVMPSDPYWARHLEELADAGIKGLKIHPYYQNFSLSDPTVRPFFAKIADLGLVVLCHSGYDIGYPGRYDSCAPADIVSLLKNIRGLKFVAAHLGGCSGHPSHATDDLVECGAYIDTSALHLNQHKDEEMRLLRCWPRERILFGTDFPWAHYPETIRWVGSVRAHEDLPDLLGGNACRLLEI
jgi:predicted TIM-barrel fold metal-dependent hydrolase